MFGIYLGTRLVDVCLIINDFPDRPARGVKFVKATREVDGVKETEHLYSLGPVHYDVHRPSCELQSWIMKKKKMDILIELLCTNLQSTVYLL